MYDIIIYACFHKTCSGAGRITFVVFLLSGAICYNMEPSGAILSLLELPGAIWGHLEPSGTIWIYLGHLRSSGGIWSVLGLFKTIWKHVESCGAISSHLGLPGAIWNHLEPFGAIWNHLARFRYVQVARRRIEAVSGGSPIGPHGIGGPASVRCMRPCIIMYFV